MKDNFNDFFGDIIIFMTNTIKNGILNSRAESIKILIFKL